MWKVGGREGKGKRRTLVVMGSGSFGWLGGLDCATLS